MSERTTSTLRAPAATLLHAGHRYELEPPGLSLGREPDNDVVPDDPNVSRFHAEVIESDGGLELRDLGSRNGTRLNGVVASRGRLEPGMAIGIGPFGLVFDGDAFVARDDRGALRLDAQ